MESFESSNPVEDTHSTSGQIAEGASTQQDICNVDALNERAALKYYPCDFFDIKTGKGPADAKAAEKLLPFQKD